MASSRLPVIKSIKVVMIGDGGVGKTTFVTRHQTGEFKKNYIATVNASVTPLAFSTNVGPVVLNIHECAGQEKLSGSRAVQYDKADACIIMFDVGSKSTYNNVPHWYDDFETHFTASGVPVPHVVLCGNKVDVKDRKVNPADITFHRKKGIQYYDISAKSNYNHEMPFLYLIRKVLKDETIAFVYDGVLGLDHDI
jgi:GTP-binding nuclear protein Ran